MIQSEKDYVLDICRLEVHHVTIAAMIYASVMNKENYRVHTPVDKLISGLCRLYKSLFTDRDGDQ